MTKYTLYSFFYILYIFAGENSYLTGTSINPFSTNINHFNCTVLSSLKFKIVSINFLINLTIISYDIKETKFTVSVPNDILYLDIK